ncbi:2-C-methyl-D-erythritol 4-phosphate cytidylyltransferase [Caloramator mitchellensis]|uniref:2-C-methyl-D-erythritol 4-phosphate cytidylyltransferase n=1 Tax=Caloramator mitchellensis TaxID=908809 RepID=A0A0R3JRK4_CALMK|nr:2-C-methyl-D-erythritol 4-phosphate cytidylyltransferase [Caloramator mitchellensis]KRQ86072.1 2-C-methyl-D-erythritol 4-phosphate cytidylyltransferase [Caloramator mitchellensis]
MISAIIVAAGKGKRMGLGFNKLLAKIDGKEIIVLTLEKFQNSNLIDEIILVVSEDELDYFRENIVNKNGFDKCRLVIGGKERQNSVYSGLKNTSNADIVLIHDGARPYIDEGMINRSIEAAREYGAATVAVPVVDTIKVVENGFSVETLERSKLYSVQTPQSFKYDLILKAHQFAMENNIVATDDTMLVEKLGYMVRIIEGSYANIKITTINDLNKR